MKMTPKVVLWHVCFAHMLMGGWGGQKKQTNKNYHLARKEKKIGVVIIYLLIIALGDKSRLISVR